MKSFIILLTAVVLVNCDNLMLGDAQNKALIHKEKVHLADMFFLLPKRQKEVNYSSPDHRIINAIKVTDHTRTAAQAEVVEGGLGHTFVKIRLVSGRGQGLNYDVEIYS